MLNAYLRNDFLKKLKKVTVLGGDKRCAVCANLFCEHGYECAVYGMEMQNAGCSSTKCVTLSDALGKSDVLILPLPTTVDGKYLYTPYSKNKIPLHEVSSLTEPHTLVFAGNIPESLFADRKKDKIVNYTENQALTLNGAVYTAEGAIKEISGICEKALSECNILVCGYGRIGKHLAKLLYSYGAAVYVSTSSPEKVPVLKNCGYTPLLTEKLAGQCENTGPFDIIINTVPKQIFDEKLLSTLAGTPHLIELASSPYGIDFGAAEKLGFCVTKLPGIPGKLYPKSAGKALFECICTELSKRGYLV